MNDITQDTLQDLAVPTASMKQHQVQLKQALLAASRPDNTSNIKDGWRNFMSRKKFVLSGATLAFIALAVVAFSLFGTNSPAASAEQLTRRGITTVSRLSPNQQQDLNLRIHGNAKTDLETAMHAKDLTTLTYDEFLKQNPNMGMGTGSFPDTAPPKGKPSQIDPHSLKYLRYTDAEGATHILGVDNSGLPALEMVYRNSDKGSAGMIRMNGGNDRGLSTNGSAPTDMPSPKGATTCATTENGTVHCSGGTAASGSASCTTAPDGSMLCSQGEKAASPGSPHQ